MNAYTVHNHCIRTVSLMLYLTKKLYLLVKQTAVKMTSDKPTLIGDHTFFVVFKLWDAILQMFLVSLTNVKFSWTVKTFKEQGR